MGIDTYSTTPASNDGLGIFDENQNPSTVNNGGRQVMADVRSWYETAEYRDLGHTPTYISATSFSVTGDKTADYPVNRALKFTDASTLYGYVTAVAYTSVTTVTVSLVSGSLSGSLSAVGVGLDPTYSGLPANLVGGARNKFTASGTNTYTGTLSNVTAYEEGLEVIGVFTNFNTSSTVTLNLNSLGAKNIYIQSVATLGQLRTLDSGMIRSGVAYKLLYTNGFFLLLNPSIGSVTESYDGTSVKAIKTTGFITGTESTTSTTYVEAVTLTLDSDEIVFSGGSLYVTFYLVSDNASGIAYGRIYRNGSPVGTEQSVTGTTPGEKTETITGWSVDDTIELYMKTNNGAYTASTGSTAGTVSGKGTSGANIATP